MTLPQEKRCSYADLLSWETELRYELYDGYPVALASPSEFHQAIVFEIGRQLGNYLHGKPCRAYSAPLDVRLFESPGDSEADVDTVLQPDLMVVCDRDKIDQRGIHGAPDLIIEVLSPGTARYDRVIKFNLYQKAGVREYWIVDPEGKAVHTFTLENGRYIAQVFTEQSKVPVSVLAGLEIDLATVLPAEEERE